MLLSATALAWKRRLLRVFPEQPVPHINFDSTSHDDFDVDIKTWLAGRIWTDVPMDAWRNLPSSGVLREKFSPSTYAYFTPAALLNIFHDADYSEYSLEWILPYNKFRRSKGVWWSDFVACFNARQKAVITECLADATSAIRNDHPASMLIDEAFDFWTAVVQRP